MAIDASFWVLLAFITLIVLMGKKAQAALTDILDQHAMRIKQELLEAQRRKAEAEQLLDKAYQLRRKINTHIRDIEEHTKRQVEDIRKEASEEISAYIESEERQLKEKIKLTKQQALNDLESQSIKSALNAAEKIIILKMNAKEEGNLIKKTLFQISDKKF
jgi:F-type H+-transporting ATPase subunit b